MRLFEPIYLKPEHRAALASKAQMAFERLADCTLCPRKCHVDRRSDPNGYCRTGVKARVAAYDAHFGEEAPLVGRNGSGTVFFSSCNLLCSFCQNYDISHGAEGSDLDDRQLSDIFMSLQSMGCHNINLVTPSHVIPQILKALCLAVEDGLHLPLVYNTGAYDSTESLELLDGVIDIYMPDFKFWETRIATQTCDAPDYPDVARNALLEMHRQVGDLVIGKDGVAQRGLLVRHLVMPNDLSGTSHVMRFIAEHISVDTYVNIMAQYRPCGRAAQTESLARAVTRQEYENALNEARRAGLKRLDRPRRVFALW